jgi:hypothetical protein
MEIRRSDSDIPSIAGRPRDKIRALGTGAQPTIKDLSSLAGILSTETSLRAAANRLQKAACKILELRDALVLWIDWPHRIAWTVDGRVNHELEETVIEAAGAGRRSMLAGAVIEPCGPPPTRAVLAFRKPSGIPFLPQELVVIGTLAQNIGPALDRLIRGDRL